MCCSKIDIEIYFPYHIQFHHFHLHSRLHYRISMIWEYISLWYDTEIVMHSSLFLQYFEVYMAYNYKFVFVLITVINSILVILYTKKITVPSQSFSSDLSISLKLQSIFLSHFQDFGKHFPFAHLNSLRGWHGVFPKI